MFGQEAPFAALVALRRDAASIKPPPTA